MRPLIVLRPEPGASATQARAEALGLEVRKLPLFQVRPLAWTPPDLAPFDGLLVTSANAVRHAGLGLEALRALPAHAVGDATATALRASGLEVAAVGTGGVDALLGSLDPGLRLLHLCGAHRHVPVAPGPTLVPLAVYEAVPTDPVDPALFAGGVVLVHSPRAGARLAELVADRAGVRVAAISDAAAAACGAGWAVLRVAEAPRDEALLSLAERLCKDSHPQ